MLSLLAQANSSFDSTTLTTTDSGSAAGLALFSGFFLIIWLVLFVYSVICMWKIFEKAGVEGWKAIIPVYNSWVLAEIAGKPGWWGIIGYAGFVPVLGIIASLAAVVLYVIIALELAKKFGKDTTFAIVGLIIFSLVGIGILAFGDAKYQGGSAAAPKAPTPPATPAA